MSQSAINTFGSAFPLPGSDTNYCQEGMSLRAWFAGQAIGAVIQQCASDSTAYKTPGETPAEYFARTAYSVADAMIAIEMETYTRNAEAEQAMGMPF